MRTKRKRKRRKKGKKRKNRTVIVWVEAEKPPSLDTSWILLHIGIVLVRFHAIRASPNLDNHVDIGRLSPPRESADALNFSVESTLRLDSPQY